MQPLTTVVVTTATISIIICATIFIARDDSIAHSYGKFPDDFMFGAATSALQIEGGVDVDGKGPEIWDTLTQLYPQKIADGRNTNDTANSYYFYEEDINAIKSMGMNHYRFSLSWSRILPDGTLRSINQAGIAYYNKLINTLLKNNIIPVVTIFHFDVPQVIQDFGGFTNDDVVDYYKVYADLVFSLFSDRVKMWITINEPCMFCNMVYTNGWLSPTIESVAGVSEYECGHNVLKAHAIAYRLYKKRYAARFGGNVGISLNSNFYYSNTNNTDDVKRALEFDLGWFANPIFSRDGGYPAVMREQIDSNSICEGRNHSRLPTFSKWWIDQIRGSADFMGLNYYTSRYVERSNPSNCTNPSNKQDVMLELTVNPKWKFGNIFFLYSVPAGLGDLLRYIKKQYNNPRVIITENGWADAGQLNDQDRIEFLRDHLTEVLNVVNNNECDLFGYTVWSAIDTFEFNAGFIPKFGLFAVNLTSQLKERIPKGSSNFMKKIILTRRIPK